MRKKKLLKIVGLSLLGLTTLLLLFIITFVFNPFEGSLPDLRDRVPRSSQFFVRKTLLKEDMVPGRFPEPHFWAPLTESEDWPELKEGPTVKEVVNGAIGVAIADLPAISDAIERESSGLVSLLDDMIGNEFMVAGRYSDYDRNPLEDPWICIFSRVSWRVRAGWGLAQWGMVQDSVTEAGTELREEDGFLVATPQGGSSWWMMREKDCLMISSSKEYLETVRQLIEGDDEVESLGQASEYRQAIDGRLDQWVEQTGGDEINALEFSIRPNDLPYFQELAATWPDRNNEDSMNERVLASFLRLTGWNFINGAFIFEPASLGIVSQVKLDGNSLTPFQQKFFKAEARSRTEWLNPFLDMVPFDAGAAFALRMPAKDFLDEMYVALDPDERTLFDETFASTGAYGSVRELIETMRFSLQPRIGFVFRKNREDTGEDRPKVGEPAPTPQIAWVFWIEEGNREPIKKLLDTMRLNKRAFAVDQVMKMNIDFSMGGGDPDFNTFALEFYNRHIPGTGEIASILFDEFFILSNSGPLIGDMMSAKFTPERRPGIREDESFRGLENELPDKLNGMVYVDGPNMSRIMEDFQLFSEQESSARPDPEWAELQRPRIEADVRARFFPQYQTVSSIPESKLDEFEQRVRQTLSEEWVKARSEYTAEDREAIRENRSFFRILQNGYFYFQLEGTKMDITGRLNFSY